MTDFTEMLLADSFNNQHYAWLLLWSSFHITAKLTKYISNLTRVLDQLLLDVLK